MKIAGKENKNIVVDILTAAFDDNKSFNAIIKQDNKREIRIRKIFEYYFDIWSEYGVIYLSDDQTACSVIAFPHVKKPVMKMLIKDLNLLFLLGIKSIKMGLSREAKIKKQHPNTPFYYLLFIGVYPHLQHQGRGGSLLAELIKDSEIRSLPIYLETYLPQNITLYKNHGFKIFHELDFDFPVYCMNRPLS
ncbi:GNAT family N-acetyltransferase [Mucilaginibacter lappiensis]|uniref:Ribosomal protein S18 acetylase RimI-like enzyme n=1 Tax=Mucilaginibacter lappiensis TaxID=354630 RepID=A0A841JRV9_9SPHI|nr:GNAT family N-acetyltransferase [Mucilaginibacter lappiensis]MBB6131528.1 ribosomal protein S18 acetylase RimI-like enzyme [Mucilaginibacter lappiensis]